MADEKRPKARSDSAVLTAASLQQLSTTQDMFSPIVSHTLHPEDSLEDMDEGEEIASETAMDVDEPEAKNLPTYALSSSLGTHASPLRDVAMVGNDMLVSAEERGMMNVYTRIGQSRTFERRDTLHTKVHAGTLTFVVAPVPPQVAGYPEHTFISGGNDNTARLWTAMGSSVGELSGHTNCVNSVGFSSQGHILTGCWDGIARVYAGGVLVQRLTGHTNAVEVLGLSTGEVVCASTNGTIQLYGPDFSPLRTISKAHDHAIRKLVVHPLGFASCGNDGFVKIWGSSGENLLSIAAHTGGKKYDSFVYGLSVTPDGGLVSCGEDQTVKVWSADGSLQQSIRHPGPVRAVTCMPNGDIVTACADRSVRVFTRSSARCAADEEQKQFESLVNMAMASSMSDIDVGSLPGEEALLQPGNQDGAIKVVRVGDKALVYKWDAMKQLWDVFGEALGASNKTIVDGKEYEVVTDVFVTDKISHKLAFNKDEHPETIADRFLASHSLPAYLRQQIVDHVTPLVDMTRVARAQEVARKDREAKALHQIPAWHSGGFELFAAVKADAMQKKMNQLNARLVETESKLAMTEAELPTFAALMQSVRDPKKYQTSPLSDAEAALVRRLLCWPKDMILPVLDCYRVLMVHQDAVRKLPPTDASICEILFDLLDAPPAKADAAFALILKTMTNFVGKRIKTSAERQASPVIPTEVEKLLNQVLDRCAECATSENDSVLNAYVMFVHNIVVWLGRTGVRDCDMYMVVASALFEGLETAQRWKIRTMFHALLTVGSIAWISPSSKEMMEEAFGEQLAELLREPATESAPALQQVKSDLQKIFSINV